MPLHLLWGDEDFNIELRLNELKSEVLKGDINPLNYRKFDNPPYVVLDEILRTAGMMFGNILNVIHMERYFLNSGKKIELTPKEADFLAETFEHIAPTNHVVFICNIPRDKVIKPDSRKKIYKALQQFGNIEQFEAFKSYQDYKAIPWLIQRAKKRKLSINQDIATKLVNLSGVNLRLLDGQLDKLELLSYPKGQITLDMVDKICSEMQDVYALPDMILNGQYSKALGEISKIIENSHYLPLLSFIQATFNNLFFAKLYKNELSSFEISKKIGLNEFVVKQNIMKVEKVPIERLLNIKQNLVKIEYQLKTGIVQDPILAFANAIVNNKECL